MYANTSVLKPLTETMVDKFASDKTPRVLQQITVLVLDLGWWWWLPARLRGFGENVRPYIPRMTLFLFFLKWKLAFEH